MRQRLKQTLLTHPWSFFLEFYRGTTDAAGKFRVCDRADLTRVPNITAQVLAKTNHWNKSELTAFLKQGSAINSTALGPMQEVVHDSLSFLTPADLEAMAGYLLDPTNQKTPLRPELRSSRNCNARPKRRCGRLRPKHRDSRCPGYRSGDGRASATVRSRARRRTSSTLPLGPPRTFSGDRGYQPDAFRPIMRASIALPL